MESSLLDVGEESTPGVEVREDSPVNDESCHFPQTLVTEKIIFCVDVLLYAKPDSAIIYFNLLKSYFNMKKKISVKPPEFDCIIIVNNDSIKHFTVNNVKDIQIALKDIKNDLYQNEEEPLKLNKVFDKIASLVEQPDPATYKKFIPPFCVYHVIWLFGRNLFIPTMENTNSFDFVMMSPYFALDVIYIYDNTLDDNCNLEISQTLLGLNENQKGYFFNVPSENTDKIYSSMSQCLGHPLFRASQDKAKYNILELSIQCNNSITNNSNTDDNIE